jgi:biopolymer transport protein ExbB/TolQ
MPSFFAQMGVWAYPMILTGILMLIQIGRVAVGSGKGRSRGTSPSGNVILVWGALNAVLGVLGSAVGISLAAGAIENAASISPPLLMGGLKVALSTTVLGMLLFALALVSWLVIRFVEGRRDQQAA